MQSPFRTLLKSITVMITLCAWFGLGRLDAQSTTFTVLYRFSGNNIIPYYGLTQLPNGALYGTCTGVEQDGGAGGCIFQINPDGTGYSVVHQFSPTQSNGANNTGGANPLDTPVYADGLFYGVTEEGGTGAYGVLYSVATNGANYTVLSQFGSSSYNLNADVEYQYCGIAQAGDGYLYGGGGCNGINNWDSQIYKISTNATGYANLHYFTYSTGGGLFNTMTTGHNGNLYGATDGDPYDGTASDLGTLFTLTPANGYTDLHDFVGTDGQQPAGSLVESTNGMLYGTASAGGTYGFGTAFRIGTNGTGFTVLHQFGTGQDGQYAYGKLLLATDGNLYGACLQGGTSGYGTIFRMATNGSNYQVLYSFTGTFTATGDHGYPNGCLFEASNGLIYGMTSDIDYNFDPAKGNGILFVLNAGISIGSSGAGVLGINRISPSPTNSSSVQWAVTFGATVTGVAATNFQLVATGLTGSPAITSVTGSGTNYTITASTGSGSGTLQLNLANIGVISPAVTNTLPFAGQAYAIDLVAPTIAIGLPSVAITNNGSVVYTVTYADANFNASTLAAGDITLNSTGSASAGSIVVAGTGTTLTVTLSNITGNGTLGISIASGTASDTAGNLAPASGASTTFTVDNTAPTITIGGPSSSLTSTNDVSYTVTYADANINTSTLAANNITVNSTETAAAGSVVVTGAGASWTVTLSGITGQGTLSISIAAGTASDLAGNLAPAAGPSPAITVDVVPFITIQPLAQSAPALGNAFLSVTANGTAPLVYQWIKDGSILASATNATLNLTNVNRASVGYYSVTVSNLVGGTLSTNILLRVIIPQMFGQVLQPLYFYSPTFQALFQDTNGTVATLSYATNFFQMQGSTNLISDWEPVSGAMSLTNGWILFLDNDPTNPPLHAYRFYRVEEQ